ncbi:hypothetical protein HNP84_001219 [Thermocatellispora tengchongensis]|uniref:Glycoside hydrolase family 127 protein n=1 Tax=Thermocatellispora tengchongensis TaxID=1073253 RepID=A0A840P0Q2_9ACTN|nr:beta-L-arabinofuranosidase domain-containing protein [Thermocatellispora tengchongensis]MBB5131513.1 hypothetical protein [Thermocatellispora tengchongensis]
MVDPVLPSSGALSPIGLDSVRLGPGFWGDRVARNFQATIPHCQEWMEREGWIGNFRGRSPRRGREFSDSEIYKLLEAMAWSGHPALPGLAATVAGAQEGDGYLNTRWSGQRYSDLAWGHELYCYGHLIQAGVARLRAYGEDELTRAARLAADHVCRRFMDTAEVCGHPVVEMALVELYRATGAERYLEMARRFVERRGLPALPGAADPAYFQDDVPVRQAQVLRGHAVRALYLAASAVDVAVETGDADLLKAVETQWERTVARRTHLTGGMGSRHADEAFGEDFELPPDRAYAETCAGVASVMLCHRLLLATGDPRYADLAERTMYNVLAAGTAPDGRSFFYSNPLQVRVPPEPRQGVNPGVAGGTRSAWFEVACCPNNIARTLASLGAYLAAADGDGLRVHHYATGEIGHDGLVLRIETGYPWSGAVTARVVEGRTARIALRVPAWAGGAALTYRGETRPAGPGYAVAEADWRPGEEIRLDLPVRPRWTLPDRRVDALRGCAAVERGPLVYCAESAGDGPPLDLAEAVLSAPAEREADGVVELEVPARLAPPADTAWPYAESHPAARPAEDATLRLIPYHLRATRGPAAMRVWLPIAAPDGTDDTTGTAPAERR